MAAREFYDNLETRDPEGREAAQFAALREQMAAAKAASPAWAKLHDGIEPGDVTSREALAALPVIRKSALTERQAVEPPLGGLTTLSPGELDWIFCSPGPIFEPGVRSGDYWRMGRALFSAGFRGGDIVYNTFAYHLTPAGHMMETGAEACGCAVVPGGVGNTEQQVQALVGLKPNAYVGTPSFLRILLERAAEAGHDVSCLTKAAVGGEALPPSVRAEFQECGIATTQSYGTADVGLIAYESPIPEGMIIDEGVIVEIVEPLGSVPVAEGEVGEVVVTALNPVYPLTRFATGDLSAILPGHSACGRTNSRIKGWMGRADQTTKVRGMFVHPMQVAQVVGRHPEISRARLVLQNPDNRDCMTLHCESASDGGERLSQAIAESIHAVCKLHGDVIFVKPDSLPDDGKLIDDERTWD